MHFNLSLLPWDFTGARFLYLKVWDDWNKRNGIERFLFQWIFRSYSHAQTGELQGAPCSPDGHVDVGLGAGRGRPAWAPVPKETRPALLQTLQTCSRP